MLVRKYSVLSIFKDMWREKTVTIITVFVCLLLGILAGFLTYRSESSELTSIDEMIAAEPSDDEPEYVTQLRNYEKSMAACQEAYDLAVEQRDNLQTYIDKSILMKIDPSNIQVVCAIYSVQESARIGDILVALQTYINDGGLKEDATRENDVDELEIEGWKEIVMTGNSGENLIISVYHYDADKAARVMDIIQKCVEAQNGNVSKIYGEYNLVLVERSTYTRAEVNFANVQNGHYNNLKSYENSIADQLIKINNFKTTITTYKEKSGITEGNSIQRGLSDTILLYAAVGLFGGFILAFVIMLVISSVSDKIQSAEHLEYSGMTILNIYSKSKKEYDISIEDTVLEIEKMVSNEKKLCLYALSDEQSNKDAIDLLQNSMTIQVVDNKEILDCPDVVIVLSSRKDTYSSLEKRIAKLSRLNFRLLGIIVCE